MVLVQRPGKNIHRFHLKYKKSIFFITTFCALLFLLQTVMWENNGGYIEVLKGQFDSGHALTELPAPGEIRVSIELNDQNPIQEVDPEFLSFALDSAQLVGGKWWDPEGKSAEFDSGSVHTPAFNFDRPELDTLVQALTPAYLRIGGSEADKIYYDMADEYSNPPSGYESVLKPEHWNRLQRFVQRNRLKFIYTFNAGPSSRDFEGRWKSDNFQSFLKYASETRSRIDVLEMGNEMNLYWILFGPQHQVSTSQYKQDLSAARKLIHQYYPDTLLLGQASAYWPVIGEPFHFFLPFLPEQFEKMHELVDLFAWHYYPQQSRRSPLAARRATPTRLLNPDYLDEVSHWAEEIKSLRDQYAPKKDLWLGETGNAQFGGEPGVSDRYISGLWWLDQLGMMAKAGYKVVVRQTLAGLDYGLLDDKTLQPNPDYWNSVLWKRLMGRKVYDAGVIDQNTNKLRLYLHSTPGKPGSFTLLAINLDDQNRMTIKLPAQRLQPVEEYQMNTDQFLGKNVFLNGQKLKFRNNRLPVLKGRKLPKETDKVTLRPLSYAFITLKKLPAK